jgi:hypothetical protein
MVDCGATSQFIDQDFTLKNGFKLRRNAVPEVLTVVDGRTSVAGDLKQEVTIQLLIDQHLENVVFQVTVMNRLEPSPTASLQVNMDLSPSLVPCFRALVFALAFYILALAYAHVAGTF